MFQDARDRRPQDQKISLAPSGKSVALLRASRAHQGAFRDRHGRWTRDAMDALCRKTSGVCTDGEIVESCPPDAGSSSVRRAQSDGGYQARYTGGTPGRPRISR